MFSSSTTLSSSDNQLQCHHKVIQDLLRALQDDELTDLSLEGVEGAVVLANRFLLGARSPVLKRMLYGSFQESRQTTISLPYDQAVLEAVVEWCSSHEISTFRVGLGRNASSARRLVQLVQAADFLELTELARLVTRLTHDLASRYPPLACVVYDEVSCVENSAVGQEALLLLQCRPYVALPPCGDTDGGIGQLSEQSLLELFKNQHLQAGEWFLFQMLQEWVKTRGDEEDAIQVAMDCADLLQLEWIEPQDLLGPVMQSGWINRNKITEAITQQALKASQDRVWSLSCRGHPVERILVERAGHANANGVYYRIPGLENGQLYSKREVACGQQYVYTLSCKPNKNRVECRIFCSKLLTHDGVRKIMNLDDEENAPCSFRPLLQVTRSETVLLDAVPTFPNGSVVAPERRKNRKMQMLLVSDGDHLMAATLAPKLIDGLKTKEINQNSLVKLLAYEKYILEGKVAIRIHKISIISQDPGHQFGHPIDYYDDDHPTNNHLPHLQESSMVTEGTVESHIGQQLQLQHRQLARSESSDLSDSETSADLPSQSLINLYSCVYSVNSAPVDSKIPRDGWKSECHGQAPTPICRWIPPSKSKDFAASNNESNTANSDWERVSSS